MTWIGVSGEIGAGKTTIARELAAWYGAAYASFGDYVRKEVQRRHLPVEREVLQDIGAELVSTHGPDEFTRIVVEDASAGDAESLVVEGVRHVSVNEALRRLSGEQGYALVYVTTPESVRAVRLVRRGEHPQQLSEYERHPTEDDVHEALQNQAEVVVSGEDIEEAVRAVVRLLGR
jgi:dephospho-CoA kinase